MKKMETLNQDIYNLIKAEGPLYWREIRERLWEKYKSKYKDKKVFGSAISNRLNQKPLANLIIKKGDQYATQNFKPSLKQNFEIQKESGPLSLKDEFIFESFRELEEISKVGANNPAMGLQRLRLFISKLPKDLRVKLEPLEKKLIDVIYEAQLTLNELPLTKEQYKIKLYTISFACFKKLMENVSNVLHDITSENL